MTSFSLFSREMSQHSCLYPSLSCVAEDEYDAAAIFKNNRDRMGYGFGVKLGYHLLKQLKRHRGFVVHTPDLFWAIARLFFCVDIFCSNAPFDTRRARAPDKGKSQCFVGRRLIRSAYVFVYCYSVSPLKIKFYSSSIFKDQSKWRRNEKKW